jgi:Hemerythrin HHE cation binding domain
MAHSARSCCPARPAPCARDLRGAVFDEARPCARLALPRPPPGVVRRPGVAPATDETLAEDRAQFLAYWNTHGRTHFRIEEEILLPAYAGYGVSHHPLVARALCDHVAIRQLAGELAGSTTPSPSILHELGMGLVDHIRLEERELFPLIENALPASALAELADAVRRAEALLSAD